MPGLAQRSVALYLAATAIAVAFLLMLTPLFHDGSSEYLAWQVLNWFMAVGVDVARRDIGVDGAGLLVPREVARRHFHGRTLRLSQCPSSHGRA